MKLTLHIDMENAAFEYPGEEVARILFNLARQIEAFIDVVRDSGGPLYDYNGNYVGRWEVRR